MSRFTESIVEDAALAWLEALGYAVLHGPAIAADDPLKNGKNGVGVKF